MKFLCGLLLAGFSILVNCATAIASQAPLSVSTSPPQSGLTVVSTYNAAIAALGTMQSGSSDPASYVSAYMWWMDTGNSLLKQRNASNTAWVTIAPSLTRLATQSETQNASNLSSGQVARALLPSGSTSAAGIVQLTHDLSSTSTTTAATAGEATIAYNTAVAAQGTANAAISNAATAQSTANAANVASANSLGIGQSYSNVLGSRAFNTVFTNSTSKPILVLFGIVSACGSPLAVAYVNSSVATNAQAANNVVGGYASFVVPSGSTYHIDTPGCLNLTQWNELR